MNKSLKIKRMAGMSIFAVLLVVLQLFCIIPVSAGLELNLGLIVIIIGSVLYGPVFGLVLGLISGFLTFMSPATQAIFWPISIVLTLLVCTLKTGLAGLVCGLIYKYFNKYNKYVVIIIASIFVPIVNTTVYSLGATLFFNGGGFFVVFGLVIANFLFEMAACAILSPVVYRLTNIATENFDLGINK